MNKILNCLEPVILLAVPAVLILCTVMGTEYTAVLTLFVAALSMVPFFLRFERRKPRASEMMPPVILAAVAAAGRVSVSYTHLLLFPYHFPSAIFTINFSLPEKKGDVKHLPKERSYAKIKRI